MPTTNKQSRLSATNLQSVLSATNLSSGVGTPFVLPPEFRITQLSEIRITQSGDFRIIN